VAANRQTKEEKDKFSREAMVHLDHLYRVARYLVEEPDEAHDLVQETYVRARAKDLSRVELTPVLIPEE
jgi:DNA-directed RNA polymerase specialized sigma24 family protein